MERPQARATIPSLLSVAPFLDMINKTPFFLEKELEKRTPLSIIIMNQFGVEVSNFMFTILCRWEQCLLANIATRNFYPLVQRLYNMLNGAALSKRRAFDMNGYFHETIEMWSKSIRPDLYVPSPTTVQSEQFMSESSEISPDLGVKDGYKSLFESIRGLGFVFSRGFEVEACYLEDKLLGLVFHGEKSSMIWQHVKEFLSKNLGDQFKGIGTRLAVKEIVEEWHESNQDEAFMEQFVDSLTSESSSN